MGGKTLEGKWCEIDRAPVMQNQFRHQCRCDRGEEDPVAEVARGDVETFDGSCAKDRELILA